MKGLLYTQPPNYKFRKPLKKNIGTKKKPLIQLPMFLGGAVDVIKPHCWLSGGLGAQNPTRVQSSPWQVHVLMGFWGPSSPRSPGVVIHVEKKNAKKTWIWLNLLHEQVKPIVFVYKAPK